MGTGDVLVSTDSAALISLWEVPTVTVKTGDREGKMKGEIIASESTEMFFSSVGRVWHILTRLQYWILSATCFL
jgi:hypothetical protein